MKNLRKQQRHSAGFSILELLLVLVILAILAGIVGVRFAGQSGKAKVTATKTEMSAIESALGVFEIHAGRYPTTQEGLEALREIPSGLEDDEWDGPYLKKKLEDDKWGNPYVYRSPGTHNNDFDLYSFGPDGNEGSDDDINNWSEDED